VELAVTIFGQLVTAAVVLFGVGKWVGANTKIMESMLEQMKGLRGEFEAHDVKDENRMAFIDLTYVRTQRFDDQVRVSEFEHKGIREWIEKVENRIDKRRTQ
jgi:hypothetical protein